MAMTTLEAHLASLEAQVGGTEKAISALVMNLKHLKKAVGYGHLADMDKSLPLVAQRAEEVRNVALSLSDAWSLDVTKHLEQGYLAELLQEADAQGVNLIERDGRLFCFPLPIMIDAREAAVRIGKKKEQRLRPKILVALLATMQKARLRFNARKFLDAIYQFIGACKARTGTRSKAGQDRRCRSPMSTRFLLCSPARVTRSKNSDATCCS
jgi:hypothetical protein